MSKAAEARKMGISLKNVQYGGELVQQLMKASAKMETVHEKLADLVTRNSDDETKYKKMMDIAEDHIKWFEKAKVWCFTKKG